MKLGLRVKGESWESNILSGLDYAWQQGTEWHGYNPQTPHNVMLQDIHLIFFFISSSITTVRMQVDHCDMFALIQILGIVAWSVDCPHTDIGNSGVIRRD